MVLAAADVDIMQVQVIDKNGGMRPVVVWRCGPDVMFAETMDGLFDADRRFTAPKWLVDQLDQLPSSKRFDARGNSYSADSSPVETEFVVAPPTKAELPSGMEDGDEDVPGARSA